MSSQSQKFSFKNKYFLLTLTVFVVYLFSFNYKFLDPFVIGTWWAPSPGGDYYSVPRSFINLLYGQSIFTTEYFPFGDHATRYFYHPLLSVVLGSWLSIFPAIVSFYVFVVVSFGIVIYCGYLLNGIINQDGKEYILLGCSVATYLMLWNGQMHVFIMLSVSLILSGFHYQKLGNHKIANLRIMIGILVSLFSKPIILLSLPYFLILPENRRTVIKSLIIYILVSVIFLLDTPLNPKGDNIIHWQNIIWQSTVADKNVGIFSISWIIVKFFELKELPANLHYLLKLPVLISLLPLIKYKKINIDNNLNYCLLGFILTTISYFLSYTVVWEYHYASLLPVIVFMLWSEMFKDKKLIKFSLFIISIPLLLQGNEIYVYNYDHIILAKIAKVTAVIILYILVLLEIKKQELKIGRWVSIGKDKKEEGNNFFYKLTWISIPILILLEAILIYFILPKLTTPISSEFVSRKVLKIFIGACLPEPLEHNRYIWGVILLFVFFLTLSNFSRFLFQIINKIKLLKNWNYEIILLTQFYLMIFFAANWNHQVDFEYIYFDNFLTVLILSVLLLFSFYYFDLNKKFYKIFKARYMRYIFISLPIFYLIIGLLPSVFTDFNICHASLTIQAHLPTTMEEFSSVLYGHTPLVDFFPQYQNLFPLIFRPYFVLFGLNFTTFTILMTSLSFLSMIFAYSIFSNITKSYLSAGFLFVPFLSACFYFVSPNLSEPWERNYFFNYYAFSPLRTFGPWLVFFLFSHYLNNKSFRKLIILFFVSSIVLINNVELGLASFVATLITTLLSAEKKLIPTLKKIFIIFSLAIGSLIISLILYCSLIYFRSGYFPDLSSFLSYQKVFGKLGFFMLPMPSFGIHYLIFITFGASVAWGILGLTEARDFEKKNRFTIMLFSGVLGFGVSVYFVGRSHSLVLPSLFMFWMFSICILFWETYRFWKCSLLNSSLEKKIPYIIPTFLVIFLFCIFLPKVPDIIPLSDQIRRFKYISYDLIDSQKRIIRFIKDHNKEAYPLMVIFPYGHQLAEKSGFYNEFPFSHQSSLLLKDHIIKVINVIKTKRVRKIFGTIPEDLKSELKDLGFIEKESFENIPKNFALIEMKTFSFWEI